MHNSLQSHSIPSTMPRLTLPRSNFKDSIWTSVIKGSFWIVIDSHLRANNMLLIGTQLVIYPGSLWSAVRLASSTLRWNYPAITKHRAHTCSNCTKKTSLSCNRHFKNKHTTCSPSSGAFGKVTSNVTAAVLLVKMEGNRVYTDLGDSDCLLLLIIGTSLHFF